MSNTELIKTARQQADDIRRDGVEFMKSKHIAEDYEELADALEAAERQLADAWDEGWGLGNEHATSDWFIQATSKEANPYRVSA